MFCKICLPNAWTSKYITKKDKREGNEKGRREEREVYSPINDFTILYFCFSFSFCAIMITIVSSSQVQNISTNMILSNVHIQLLQYWLFPLPSTLSYMIFPSFTHQMYMLLTHYLHHTHYHTYSSSSNDPTDENRIKIKTSIQIMKNTFNKGRIIFIKVKVRKNILKKKRKTKATPYANKLINRRLCCSQCSIETQKR